MASTKSLNLDAEFGFDTMAEQESPFIKIELLGVKDVRVMCDVSSFAAVNVGSGDASSILLFLQSMIHPEDWPEFSKVASMHPAFRGEEGAANLWKVINRLTEVAGQRPSSPSSTSRATASRTTSTPKSAGKSSAARVARSPR